MQIPSPADPDHAAVSGSEAGDRFRSDVRGAVAIEYGLIAAILVVALITVLPATGNSVSGLYNKVLNAWVN